MTEPRPSLATIFGGFLRLGLTAFGGPAMIPAIRRYAVEEKKWLPGAQFKVGVALGQVIPGATAMQVAAYVGLKARGLPGALAAYTGFGLPAFLLITALSAVYSRTHNAAGLAATFAGLKVVVVALITSAAIDASQRYAQRLPEKLLALAAGLMLGFGLDPLLAILGGCAVAMLLFRDAAQHVASPGLASPAQNIRVHYAWLAGLTLCLAAGLACLFAVDRVSFDLATLMLRIDLFAFGGGYVSVPLMLHEVVEVRGWMDLPTFMDGIALGQVTPGPIVMTAAFVGYLQAGLPAALVATVSVFAPSFLLLAATAPCVEAVLGSVLVQRALHGSLATLVGLLAAISGRFGLAMDWSPAAALLAAAAFVALRAGANIFWVVLAGGGLGFLLLR